MRTAGRLPGILAVVLALAGGCSFPLFDRASERLGRTRAVEHVPGAGVRVELENGSILVEAEDREDVEIVASLQSHSIERLRATAVTSERDEAGTLLVEVRWPGQGRQSHERCHVRIALPDADGVKLTTRNGSVNVSGLSGEADLRTHNGGVRLVRHDGPIDAHTNNGRIQIAATGAHPIEAKTHNGSIEVENAAAEVEATTSNGAVTLTLADSATGPVEAKTHNGAVTLRLGATLAGSLSMSNNLGDLVIDDRLGRFVKSRTKHEALLVWDEEGPESSLSTNNGSVRVEQRGE
ncbi:MAG: DUF4097 family beta strand repeat-containing protein [Planctomycetota bacterium]